MVRNNSAIQKAQALVGNLIRKFEKQMSIYEISNDKYSDIAYSQMISKKCMNIYKLVTFKYKLNVDLIFSE